MKWLIMLNNVRKKIQTTKTLIDQPTPCEKKPILKNKNVHSNTMC